MRREFSKLLFGFRKLTQADPGVSRHLGDEAVTRRDTHTGGAIRSQADCHAEITYVKPAGKKLFFGDVWLKKTKISLREGLLPFPYKLGIDGFFEIGKSEGGMETDFQPKAIQVIVDWEVFAHTDHFSFKQDEGRWFFSIEVGLLGCGKDIELEVVLIGKMRGEASGAEHRVSIGQIGCRRMTTAVAHGGRLRPLLMSGLGRSETTLMMKLLLQHQKILALPKYPFENQPAQYWLHALRVLSNPADRHSETPIVGFQQMTNRITSNPFHFHAFMVDASRSGKVASWIENDHIRHMAAFFMGQIEQYYTVLGGEVGKEDATYFVEKTQPNVHSLIFHELYEGAREIFIVRHPFDVLCSVRSFFPENAFYQTDTYIVALRIGYDRMLARIEASEGRCFVVDYNQLIRSQAKVTGAVLDFLELPNIESRQGMEGAENKNHITSADSEQSIGRWKKDLSEREIELAKREFAGTMLRIKGALPTFDPEYAP